MHLLHFTPANPVLRRDAFDNPDYIFELKHDGFRGLAYVEGDGARLVSRRGNPYRSFPRLCGAIGDELKCEAVLDGEIVCLDAEGRPHFYGLVRRRGEPILYVFDLLWLDGKDLRERPLIAETTCAPYTSSLKACYISITSNNTESSCSGWRLIAISKASSRSGGTEPTVIDGGRSATRTTRSMREGTSCSRSGVLRPRARRVPARQQVPALPQPR